MVTGAWHEFVGAFAIADPLYQALNAAIAGVAAAERARFAHPFALFNPQGDPAAELATICTLTLLCSEGDGHPSDRVQRAGRHRLDSTGDGRLGG